MYSEVDAVVSEASCFKIGSTIDEDKLGLSSLLLLLLLVVVEDNLEGE